MKSEIYLFQGLQKVGSLGNKPKQNLVYKYYPQLENKESIKHCRVVNDVFSMCLICVMEGNKSKRIFFKA